MPNTDTFKLLYDLITPVISSVSPPVVQVLPVVFVVVSGDTNRTPGPLPPGTETRDPAQQTVIGGLAQLSGQSTKAYFSALEKPSWTGRSIGKAETPSDYEKYWQGCS